MILRPLSDYTCVEDCFNKTQHTFYCDIDTAPYQGLRVDKIWEFNGKPIGLLDKRESALKYLRESPEKLVMNISHDDTDFDETFANAQVTCRYQIFDRNHDSVGGPLDPPPKYDTVWDDSLRDLLKADVRKNASTSRAG